MLERFAELAGLSLVMDVAPPGTFSYFDQRPYTVTEALDLINRVLLSQGFLLIRNKQFLVLVNIEEPIPANLVQELSEDELGNRADNELVRLSLDLNYAQPEAIAKSISSLQSKVGTATPLASLRKLLVTDLVVNLRRIVPLVHQLDLAAKPSEPKPKPSSEPQREQIITLEHLDAASIATALGKLFESATIVPVPERNTLVVLAKESVAGRIEKLIKAVDQPPTSEQAATQQGYPLKYANATALAASLEKLFTPRKLEGQEQPKPNQVKIAADETNNVLLVSATPTVHERIRQL
ncbi:MAG TPA: hypothetical protein EYP14_11730, partial [Planctomycetaceae bacterium]|nr:hypothetical protein [Planctomycetaceae bacterium]